jgi:hypothetical protein
MMTHQQMFGSGRRPDDRVEGDFALTREIIPQPDKVRGLAGAGCHTLEKILDKLS